MNTNKSRLFTRFVAGPIAAAGILGGVAMGLAAGAMRTPARRITPAAVTRRTSGTATSRVVRTETSGPTSGISGSGTTTGIIRSGGATAAEAVAFCTLSPFSTYREGAQCIWRIRWLRSFPSAPRRSAAKPAWASHDPCHRRRHTVRDRLRGQRCVRCGAAPSDPPSRG